MKLIEVKLRGPATLLGGGDVPALFEFDEAWQPGFYLWTFLYNQSDRINHVGTTGEGVAQAHAAHVAAFLRGEHAFHDAGALAEGRLQRVFSPGDALESLIAHGDDLRAELRALRVFFAPVPEGELVAARIAAGIARHIKALGGKAAEWFDAGRAGRMAAAAGGEPLTVRFFRPVHMASMPDEIDV